MNTHIFLAERFLHLGHVWEAFAILKAGEKSLEDCSPEALIAGGAQADDERCYWPCFTAAKAVHRMATIGERHMQEGDYAAAFKCLQSAGDLVGLWQLWERCEAGGHVRTAVDCAIALGDKKDLIRLIAALKCDEWMDLHTRSEQALRLNLVREQIRCAEAWEELARVSVGRKEDYPVQCLERAIKLYQAANCAPELLRQAVKSLLALACTGHSMCTMSVIKVLEQCHLTPEAPCVLAAIDACLRKSRTTERDSPWKGYATEFLRFLPDAQPSST